MVRIRSVFIGLFLSLSIHVPASAGIEVSSGVYRTQGAGGSVIEVLTGEAASNHLRNLKARRVKAFETSDLSLRSRGWRPTGHAVVMRTLRPANARRDSSADSGIALVQNIYTDEGEVVFSSWTDGDNQTWEGEMWAINYSTGGEVLQEGQIDSLTHDVTYESTVWSKAGARDKDPVNLYRPQAKQGSGILLAKNADFVRDPSIKLVVDMRKFFKDWIGCTLVGCGTSVAGCYFSGPLYIECVVVLCAVSKDLCALNAIIQQL